MLQAGTNGAASVEVVEAVQFPSASSSYGHSVGESPSSTAASSPMAGNDGNMHSLSQSQSPLTPAEEASVTYQVRLGNGYRIRVVVFVVHEEPFAAVAAAGGATHFTWRAVARSECKKGCSGPVLRSIQRFGRLGRRSGAPPNFGSGGGSGGGSPVMPPSSSHYTNDNNSVAGSPGQSNPCNSPAERDKVKEAKYLYLSIDEAGTHVGARAFRLVAAAYDASGLVPLGATVSPPIRVLANNDVPTGAAFITLHLPLRSDWQGWVPGRSGGGVAAAMRAAAAAASAAGIGSSPLGNNNNSSSSSPAVATQRASAATAAVASPPRSPNKRPNAAAAARQQAQARQQQQTQAFAASSLPHLLLSHAVSSSLLNDPSAAAVGAAPHRALPPPVSAAAVPSDDGEYGGGGNAAAGNGNGGSPPKRQRKQEGGEGSGKEPAAAATGAHQFSLSAGAGVPAPPAAAALAKPSSLSEDPAAPSPSAALAARLFLTGVGSPTAAAAAAANGGNLLPRLAASRLFSISGNNPSSAPGSPGLPQLAPAFMGSWGAQHHHHLLSAIGVSGNGGGSSSGGSGSPLALDALSGGNTPTAWRTASLSALVAGWPMTPRSMVIAQAAAAAGTGLQSAGGSGNPLQHGVGSAGEQQQAKETAAAVAAAPQFDSATAP